MEVRFSAARGLKNATALIAFGAGVCCSGAAQAQAAPTATEGTQKSPDDVESQGGLRPAKSPSVRKPDEQSLDPNAIVVTARKRAERLQDVPISITALQADTLVQQGLVRLQDYYTTVPGLSLTQDDHGGDRLIVRGLESGSGSSTVNILVDDVPVYAVPDLDPSELAQIELLRGPQGTLYGSASVGGLLKYETVDPSTKMLSGRIEGGIVGVQGGGDLGYNLRGALNVPVSDTIALRGSAFDRRDPGYIDNVQTGQKDINSSRTYGGHFAAFWRPSDDFSVKLGLLSQDRRLHGGDFVDSNLADLQQDALINTGGIHKNDMLLSALIKAKFSGVQLTNVSSYGEVRQEDSIDFTPLLGDLTEFYTSSQGLPIVRGSPLETQAKTRRYTEELRATGTLVRRLDWLIGGFFSKDIGSLDQEFYAVDQVNGNQIAQTADEDLPDNRAQEAAVFGTLTAQLSRRFDIQIGGRESWNRGHTREIDSGPFIGGTFVTDVPTHSAAFTYLVTPRFRLSDDAMFYARIASGYRPGGASNNCVLAHVPCTLLPDTTTNYEVGAKGQIFQGLVQYDVSAYDIYWKDLHVNARAANGFVYGTNAGAAKSQGVEISLVTHPMGQLTISGWFAYNYAVLAKSFPPSNSTYGLRGDPLPDSAKYSGNLAVSQHFQLEHDLAGNVGATVRYLSKRLGNFVGSDQLGNPTGTRASYPGYSQLDVHGELTRGSWSLNLFVNNVTNKRGILISLLDDSRQLEYIVPRTIGLNIAKEF